ncbi:hypothetical protein SLE2022_192900 [Rubroshorea leprosula]
MVGKQQQSTQIAIPNRDSDGTRCQLQEEAQADKSAKQTTVSTSNAPHLHTTKGIGEVSPTTEHIDEVRDLEPTSNHKDNFSSMDNSIQAAIQRLSNLPLLDIRKGGSFNSKGNSATHFRHVLAKA